METKPRSSEKDAGPRERLLETASQLFYHQGYRGTGINQLIKEAGIAKASFYDHFPDKESLYVAFLEKQHVDWKAWLLAEVASARSGKGRVKALFAFLETWMKGDSFRGCPFINSASEFPDADSAVRAAVRNAKNDVQEFIASTLKEFFSEEYSDKELSRMTEQIYVLVDGAIVASQIYGDVWPIQSAAKVAEGLLE